MNTVINFAVAAVVVAAWLLVGAWRDGVDNHAAEWDQSKALQELRATEAGTVRRQVAAQKLCTEARGPNSEPRWMDDDSLVCTVRAGVVVAGKP